MNSEDQTRYLSAPESQTPLAPPHYPAPPHKRYLHRSPLSVFAYFRLVHFILRTLLTHFPVSLSSSPSFVRSSIIRWARSLIFKRVPPQLLLKMSPPFSICSCYSCHCVFPSLDSLLFYTPPTPPRASLASFIVVIILPLISLL